MTVKLTLLYHVPENTDEFDRYYLETHVPLAAKLPELQRLEVSRVAGDDQPFHIVSELWFADLNTLQDSMASSQGELVRADVPNFAPLGAVRLISEIVYVVVVPGSLGLNRRCL